MFTQAYDSCMYAQAGGVCSRAKCVWQRGLRGNRGGGRGYPLPGTGTGAGFAGSVAVS